MWSPRRPHIWRQANAAAANDPKTVAMAATQIKLSTSPSYTPPWTRTGPAKARDRGDETTNTAPAPGTRRPSGCGPGILMGESVGRRRVKPGIAADRRASPTEASTPAKVRRSRCTLAGPTHLASPIWAPVAATGCYEICARARFASWQRDLSYSAEMRPPQQPAGRRQAGEAPAEDGADVIQLGADH